MSSSRINLQISLRNMTITVAFPTIKLASAYYDHLKHSDSKWVRQHNLDVTLPIPHDIVALETSSLYQMVFVFESSLQALIWRKQYILWKQVPNRDKELYLQRYYNDGGIEELEEMIRDYTPVAEHSRTMGRFRIIKKRLVGGRA